MSENKRILSGMRATSPKLHLGNYEGALRNWVDLQNQGYEMFCMVADWHSLTTMSENSGEIGQNSIEITKDYIAAGLDPDKSAIFIQSHVKEHAELHLLFSMMTPQSWLERTPTYKEKLQDLASFSPSSISASFLEDLVPAVRKIQSIRDIYVYQLDTEEKHPDASRLRLLINGVAGIAAMHAHHISSFEDHQLDRALKARIIAATRELTRASSESDTFFNALDSRVLAIDCVLIPSNDLLIALNSIEGKGVEAPYGLLGYPVLQTSDILLYRPYGVPVGRDQAPHLEIGNDIGARFNRLYNVELFEPYKYMIPEDETRAKLPGLDMRKMSKSYDNGINLSDTAEETAKKIKTAFTTPSKIKMDDPGIPEGCAVCQYLKVYSPDWKTQWEEDRQGLRGCSKNKTECTEAINEYFRPMRERRAQLDDATVREILRQGAAKATEVAAATMVEVRAAMGLLA